jgi:hypothetical protein
MMQFFKSTLVLTLAMATYVTPSLTLLQPRQQHAGNIVVQYLILNATQAAHAAISLMAL